jgi:membrane protein YdbS with pleckstrin-like domain
MSQHIEHASRWIYRGIWAVLVRGFYVPEHPPTLPAADGEMMQSFRPAESYLHYLKFCFWCVFVLYAGPMLSALTAVAVLEPWLALILVVPALLLVAVPGVLSYIALHLRYDTTWYVMSARSLRIRRGIWIIHETTNTFENVQNVEVNQGPLQRWFGIADVRVDTAGGGGKSAGTQNNLSSAGHKGLIEGVSNAAHIRDLILSRLRQSKSAGLGDEAVHPHSPPAWTAEHLAVLREMREVVVRLAAHA